MFRHTALSIVSANGRRLRHVTSPVELVPKGRHSLCQLLFNMVEYPVRPEMEQSSKTRATSNHALLTAAVSGQSGVIAPTPADKMVAENVASLSQELPRLAELNAQ